MKKFESVAILSIAGIAAAVVSMPTFAGGVFSTDRFGYTGTVTRYASQSDAENLTNALDSIVIGNRDASFGFVDDAGAYDVDQNILMGSWWYTTSPNGPGWGNVNGNTGVGFMQLYDADGSTDTSVNMGFSNFDGTYWTDYTLQVQGGGAGSGDYARFSVYDNLHDAGNYISYALDITATGLMGVQTGDVIEANNHATGVSGTFSALFELSDSSPANGNEGQNDGFYVIDLIFDMNNWAYSQNGNLTGPYHDGGNIYDSLFVETGAPVVPVPAAAGLGLIGMAFVSIRRRFRKTA